MSIVEIIANLNNNDGATFKKGNVINYKSGWQVADHGVEVKSVQEAVKAVENFGGTCGIWFENGIYYIDHSFRVNTKKEAMEIGQRFNQISIFGWRKKVLAFC